MLVCRGFITCIIARFNCFLPYGENKVKQGSSFSNDVVVVVFVVDNGVQTSKLYY